MVLRLFDPKKATPWIHPSERGSDKPTVFHIIPLSEAQSRRLMAAHPTSFENGKMQLDRSAMLIEMFLSNVPKIDGVRWPGGGITDPVTITSEEDRLRFLESVEPEIMNDVYAAIQNTAVLDEGTVKN